MFTYQQINELTIPIPEEFRGLDSFRDVQVFWKNLPHWRQDGATYFVTFRQNDSIPAGVWGRMTAEALRWKSLMAQSDTEKTDRLEKEFREFRKKYATKLEVVLDESRGSCELRKPKFRKIVEKAMFHFDGDRYDLEGYAVMPNHVHVIVRPLRDWSLEAILQSWKSFSARKINAMIVGKGTFWQSSYHDRIIRDEDHFRKAARYILKNPLKANIGDESASLYLKGTFEKRRTDLQVGSRSRGGAVNTTSPMHRSETSAEDDDSSASSLRTDLEIGSPFLTSKPTS